MKTVLALLLALVASSSFAAAVPLSPGPGIAASSSGFTTAANFTGQFSAASFNSNFTANVGGKAVTMPATMRMAANAGQFAVSAVRLNPAGLITSAVATWLLSQGLQWANNQWNKTETPQDGKLWALVGSSDYYATRAEACMAGLWRCSPNVCTSCTYSDYEGVYYFTMKQANGQNGYGGSYQWRYPNGAQTRPATDADWDQLAASALPDPVAGELAAKGVPLPLDVPHIAPQDIPLSDPYVDPVTGKRYRDQARLTPSSDAKTADVQTTKQEVDEAGNPEKQEDGQTDKPPEEQTDFCKKNPDASSCKPFDEAPDSELQKKDNPFSLNPVSGFGADNASCPAPQNLFTAGGQQITWDWGKFCTFAQGIRPLIIGFAWLTAIMIVVSVGRRNG